MSEDPKEEKKEAREARRAQLEEALQPNQLDAKQKKSLANRIVVAALMIAVGAPCTIFAGWYLFALIALVSLVAIYEIIKAPQKKFPWYVWLTVYAFTLFYAYFPVLRDAVAGAIQTGKWAFSLVLSVRSLWVYAPAAAGEIILLFWFGIMNEKISFSDVAYFIAVSFLLGLGFQSILYLRNVPYVAVDELGLSSQINVNTPLFSYWGSVELFFFCLIAALLNDTFAYFVGIFFGKHHMNVRISPKKTWEGFFGGWLLTAASLAIYGLLLSYHELPLLPGVLDKDHWFLIVIASFLSPLLGDLGDLSFSYIKRHFGFKDYGWILGAHGGVLDRFDSLMFVCLFESGFVSAALKVLSLMHS